MITDPLFYFFAVPAILIFGIAKGGFGNAIGVVAVPLMALAVSPLQAAAILLPILCVMDVFAIRKFWRQWDVTNIVIMLPAGCVGVLVGSLTFSYLNEGHVRLLIGLLALIFALNFWLKSPGSIQKEPDYIKGAFWSVIGGFTSFGIHSGGPPVNIYLLPQKLHPKVFMGTCAMFFWITNYVKLIPYFILGQLDSQNLQTSLVLLPLAPIGVGFGYYLHTRVSTKKFYNIFNFFLIITGCKLTYDGIMLL
ncbi:MAG: sulfite exporter TauE/SafE family protein [Oceanospirillaceae bacterium]|nr:sulfite exporter TauE/SafE family protein [Oceanospirillaceae bacterium]